MTMTGGRRTRRRLGARALLAVLFAVSAVAAAAETPQLQIAVLKFGTVGWLTSAIVDNQLDRAEGYSLEVVAFAGDPATTLAFQSGDADLFVTDWVWVQGRRDAGEDVRFAPYSVALGALMTRDGAADLCALKGRRIGVVGGDRDKSWLVYRALARQRCGFDLGRETETIFGAPPLMARQLETGAVDAVSTYWHWAAKLEAAGASRLLGADEAMAALGIAPPPPLIGFVWNARKSDAGMVAAFLRSVGAAQALLRDSDAEWERLRPLMKPASDAEFVALRDRFRDGMVGAAWTPAMMQSAAKLHALLGAEAPGADDAAERPLDPAGFRGPDADAD